MKLTVDQYTELKLDSFQDFKQNGNHGHMKYLPDLLAANRSSIKDSSTSDLAE